MKRIAILLVALLLFVSAARLMPAAKAEAPKPWRVVFVNALVGHPVYNDQDRGILDAVKDFGGTRSTSRLSAHPTPTAWLKRPLSLSIRPSP